MKTISLNNIKAKAIKNKTRILSSVSRVIASGSYLAGNENEKLEKNLLDFLGGIGYITTVASGHDALTLCLSSLKLKPTDEVVFPALSYPTSFPVYLSGAKAVAVDSDNNGQVTLANLKKVLTKKTRVVIVTHLYGLTGDILNISQFCRQKKIYLIEDCAQSFGTTYRGRYTGTFGHFGCFSFYPTKNLGTLGDGGAIWSRNKKSFNYLKMAKSYGSSKQYHSQFVSGHSRLPEIQAAILNVYLKDLPVEKRKRQSIYSYYQGLINKNRLSQNTRLLTSAKHSDPCHHLLVIEAKNRNYLKRFLEQNQIPTLIHYPNLIYKLKKTHFPNANLLTRNVLSLPFHPNLTKKEINLIVKTIKKFYQYD